MQELYQQLKMFGHVRVNEPLAKHTTFKIGGPADFFVEVIEVAKLTKLLSFLSGEGIEWFILGEGSNMLFSDEGFRGVVIKVKSQSASWRTKVKSHEIETDSGVLLSQVVNLALQNNLSGLEWAAGVPGTVGGAVRGNAGAFGHNTSDCIEKVEIWRDGEILELNHQECGFAYRESNFKHNTDVVLRAWFKLAFKDKKEILAEMQGYLKLRGGRYPTAPNAGSFFKNVELKKWPGDRSKLPEDFIKRGTVPVGWLVEQVEMKGYTVGGAKVAEEHGNFIVSHNHATAQDVLTVVAEVQEKIYNKFGIEIEPEVEIFK